MSDSPKWKMKSWLWLSSLEDELQPGPWSPEWEMKTFSYSMYSTSYWPIFWNFSVAICTLIWIPIWISHISPSSIFFSSSWQNFGLVQRKQNTTTSWIFGFRFTAYEKSLLLGVQSINRIAGSSNQMSFGRNQRAHSFVVDDILEEHFSISLHHKRLVRTRNKRSWFKDTKIII